MSHQSRRHWPQGTAIATREVLAGAYRGRDIATRVVLSHAVYVDSEGAELATVCRGVKLDNLVDCYGSPDGRQVYRPTCAACLARLMPTTLDTPRNATRRKMKGYGIILPGLELAYDHRYGRPYFVKTKRAAVRALEHGLANWLGESAEVVRVEIESNTYTVRPC